MAKIAKALSRPFGHGPQGFSALAGTKPVKPESYNVRNQ
jgi:hypothetical protein